MSNLPLHLTVMGDSFRFSFADATFALCLRKLFVAYIQGYLAFETDLFAVELLFAELVGKVARYAPGPVDVQVRWHERGTRLEVMDRGPGYELAPSLPADVMAESHRGLFIVASYAYDLFVERRDGRTVTGATLPIQPRWLPVTQEGP